ncbi:translocation/assembly module TamB domain-containing protein [Porphyromonas sp.]|uniref:translocation/assembly module TamB domain-containing protein n=1 Tax=Porphyromonas sp. TaxID=1924944 RepID=UPI0026DB833E|nr:translocation/assembly module TamB domain-containing protein [Porphyromonas sp.]MDO4771579.1 translocation/assembly module TamB domain-containing protein [Porphyromonas sp.]
MEENKDILNKDNKAEETAPETVPPKKRRNRAWKWILGVVLFILLIPPILVGLLYLPPVQNLVIDLVSTQVSKATGWNVSVGRFHLKLPLTLDIGDVLALSAQGDTIAYVSNLEADIPIAPLFQGDIPVSSTMLSGAIVDFRTADSTLWIKGNIDEFEVHNASINLKESKMSFSNVHLADADVYVFYGDTTTKVKPDTVKQPTQLKFYIGKIDIERVRGAFAMHPDTNIVDVSIIKAKVANGEINLEHGFYRARDILLSGNIYTAGPKLDMLPTPWSVKIDLHKAHYDSINMSGLVRNAAFQTYDGWWLRSLSAEVNKDEKEFEIKDIDLQLNSSYLSGDARIPFKGWMPDSLGDLDVSLRGLIYLNEVKRFFAPEQELPKQPMRLALMGKGRMDSTLRLRGDMSVKELINLRVDGTFNEIMQDRRSAKVKINATTGEVMETLGVLGIKNTTWRIPQKLTMDGYVEYSANKMATNSKIITPRGVLTAEGYFMPKSKAYKANVSMIDFDIRQFLPRDTIGLVRAHLIAEGRGTDVFSPHTYGNLYLVVDSIEYMQASLKNITVLSELKNHQLFAAINSPNEALGVSAQVDATLMEKNLVASVNILLDTIIPSQIGLQLGVLEAASLELRSSLRSDLDEYYSFVGEIENAHISTDKGLIRPTNIYMNAGSSKDSLNAGVKSGDLVLDFSAKNGLKDFLNRVDKLSKEIAKFSADTTGITDISPWIKLYPDMKLTLTMGRSNPLRTYLDELYLGWKKLSLEIGTSTDKGLAGEVFVDHFQKEDFRVDQMDAVIRQDSSFFYAVASVHKEKFKDQQPFNAMLSLTTNVHRTEAFTQIQDRNNESFLQLGVDMTKMPNNDLKFSFTPDPQILAYNKFAVKGANYVRLPANDRMRIQADLDLEAEDESGISVKSAAGSASDTLTLAINNFSLEKIKNLSFVPDMDGLINLKANWIKTGDINDYTAFLRLNDFRFDKKEVGSIIMAGHTRPKETGTYAVAQVALDGSLVASSEAFIPTAKNAKARWYARINDLPLEKANPFLPKDMIELKGRLNADIENYDTSKDIQTTRTTTIGGTVFFDSASVFIPKINEAYRLDNKKIHIKDDILRFDNFALEANNNAKLYTNGSVRLNDDMKMNLTLKGSDMLLLDSKRTDKTMVYGLISADADIRLRGSASALNVTGNVSINGNSNITYVAQDSPLENRNKFTGLIEFTDFSDTLFVAKKATVDSLSLGGMNIKLGVHIDPALRATAILTKDEANKAYIQGGGDLNFSMPPYGMMSLNGTFEIRDGYVYYNFPPISRKFTVEKDSRVTWSGNIMNPNVDFKATSRIKSDVAKNGEAARKVNFDVSIVAKNNVENLSLLFTMDTPEDLSMRNNIMAMTEEERGRQAVMLLATGMYFGSQGPATTGFDVNATLSSLLASQLNSLVGEALDAEINFGIEGTSAETGRGTNYSYSIAKKFYNDRINVIVGGQVETGNQARGLGQSFINNMSIDYRLDKAGTHYVRLFHKKNYENLLDGEVIETGIGYVLRRRMARLGDLFKFKARRPQPQLPLKVESTTNPPTKQ